MSKPGEKRKARSRCLPLSQLDEHFTYLPDAVDKRIGTRVLEEFPSYFEGLERPMVMVYGKLHQLPRDQVSCGTFSGKYLYSKHEVAKMKVTALMSELFDLAKVHTGVAFNFALINRYVTDKKLNLKDKVGRHADDEPRIDQSKPIVSFSFGISRDFDVTHQGDTKKGECRQKYRQKLNHCDVVIMKPGAQSKFYHEVPARAKEGIRYNVTMRVMKE